ncbi:MAG: hypothetical protein ABI831_11020 [Betaproteobacteria bacterium]
MKRSNKFAVGIVTMVGLGLSVALAYAQPGQMGDGMKPGMMGQMGDGKGHEGMEGAHGMAGMNHGMRGGMKNGAIGAGAAGPMALHSLMTPEEHGALMEKMHSAKSPEERRTLAQATHAEMEKRAKDKGIALPEHDGSHAGHTH